MDFSKKNRSFFFKLFVSVSIFGFLLFFTEPATILHSILSISPLIYLSATCLFLLSYGVNAIKWHLLLPRIKFMRLLKFNFIGAFYSLILPGQVSGEIAKTWRLAKGKKGAEEIAASVIVDRITGLIGLSILTFAGAILSRQDLATVILIPAGISVVLLSTLTLFLQVPFVFNAAQYLIRLTMSPIAYLHRQMPKAMLLIEHLRHYSNAPLSLLASILLGTLFQAILILLIFLLSTHLDMGIEIYDIAWILGIISILTFLPISISGIGVRELGFVGLLGLFGVDFTLAFTLSLLLFSLQILGAMIGAFYEFTNTQ